MLSHQTSAIYIYKSKNLRGDAAPIQRSVPMQNGVSCNIQEPGVNEIAVHEVETPCKCYA